MKKSAGNKFAISIKPRKGQVRKTLLRTFLIALVAFFLAGLFYLYLYHNRWTMLLIFTCALIGFGALYFFMHFLRLSFLKKGLLEFDVQGLTDHGSFLRLGHIKLTEIKHIRMSENIFGQWLQIKLKNESPSWRVYLDKHVVLGEFYNIFIGRKLLIPMNIIQQSKFELESQLIHLFNELMNKQNSGAQAGSETNQSEDQDKDNDQFQTETAIPLFGQLSEDQTEILNPSAPPIDENSVLRKIRGIKEKIKTQGFDRLICDLWIEEISRYPEWAQKNDSRLSPELQHIGKTHESSVYDEVTFSFKGVRFQFGFRREIEEKGDSEGLLSIGADGRVVMAARVRIEIGMLEPLDIEQFLEGPWQAPLEVLSRLAAQRRLKESHLRLHLSAEDQKQKQEKSKDLTELKRKFGLDEG